MIYSILATLFVLAPIIPAQLSGPVGPLVNRDSKKIVTCNVLDYGAVANDQSNDVGAAITAAFADCSYAATLYVPPGNFYLATYPNLENGVTWAFQLDGILYRNSDATGNLISISGGSDFEMYSSTGKGAIQGYGYEYLEKDEYGARLIRVTDTTDFSLHDFVLVDSPAFHLVMDTVTNAEVYNMVIWGGQLGGTDGIDVWGSNVWIHDVQVSNRDECVTTKSPASHFLIENIHCNWSGGCAMGSLATDTAISNIQYNNVYTIGSNQMYLFKSNGGSGTVKSVSLTNFLGHKNAYALDLDSAWVEETLAAGDGVAYSDITFSKWSGDVLDGESRPPIDINCPAEVPCEALVIEDLFFWTNTENLEYYRCENAYGDGYCLAAGDATKTVASTSTLTTAPAGWSATTMPNDLTTGWATNSPIPIPTIPASFFPNTPAISARLG